MYQTYWGEISKNGRLLILICSVIWTSKLNNGGKTEGKDDELKILSDENIFEPFRRQEMGV